MKVFKACVGWSTVLGKSVREAERWMTVLDLREPTVTYVYQDGEDTRVFDSVSSLKRFPNFGCPLGEILCSGVGKNLCTNINSLQSLAPRSSQTWIGWFKSYLPVTWRMCSESNAKTAITFMLADGNLSSAASLAVQLWARCSREWARACQLLNL